MSQQSPARTKIEPFEFQNWQVYRKSIDLVGMCKKILEKDSGVKGLSDQLTRASLSIPLNIAEGVSRFGAKEKLNFFRIAKGSTFESVACLDVLRTLHAIDQKHYQEVLEMFCEVGKMLSGLIRTVQDREKRLSVRA